MPNAFSIFGRGHEHELGGVLMRNFGLGAFATDESNSNMPDYKQLFHPATEGQYVATTVYKSAERCHSSVTETARLVREPDYESIFRNSQAAIVRK
jgi:hypothetical protein